MFLFHVQSTQFRFIRLLEYLFKGHERIVIMKIHPSAYVTEKSFIAGDVEIHAHASIWPFASVRGDTGKITVGEYTNIQDNVTIHEPTTIGAYVSVGHNAVLHGCTIGDNVIIGMHATVLNNVTVGKNCIIGAHALVTEGKEIPDNSLVVGVPGKRVKTLDASWEKKIRENAEIYHTLSQRYITGEYDEYR
jgi:carbonic anhydrase/acetyltransferase-like protein (isoleucine patch superfamily)